MTIYILVIDPWISIHSPTHGPPSNFELVWARMSWYEPRPRTELYRYIYWVYWINKYIRKRAYIFLLFANVRWCLADFFVFSMEFGGCRWISMIFRHNYMIFDWFLLIFSEIRWFSMDFDELSMKFNDFQRISMILSKQINGFQWFFIKFRWLFDRNKWFSFDFDDFSTDVDVFLMIFIIN